MSTSDTSPYSSLYTSTVILILKICWIFWGSMFNIKEYEWNGEGLVIPDICRYCTKIVPVEKWQIQVWAWCYCCAARSAPIDKVVLPLTGCFCWRSTAGELSCLSHSVATNKDSFHSPQQQQQAAKQRKHCRNNLSEYSNYWEQLDELASPVLVSITVIIDIRDACSTADIFNGCRSGLEVF